MRDQLIDPATLKMLQRLDSRRFIAALAGDYLVVAAALVAGHLTLVSSPWSWLLWPVIWTVIASRQHALLILMHEATHGLAFNTKWLNEFVGEVICGGPMTVSMTTYLYNHLAHHKWMNEPRDPDWARKLADADERASWVYPLKDATLGFWLRFWVRSIAYQFRSFKEIENPESKPPVKRGLAQRVSQIRLLSYLLLAAALTVFGLWLHFLLFWVVPLVLVMPFLMRIRAIAEHFALDQEGYYDEVRNVKFRHPIEKALFTPHYIAMHLDHHLFASVPFYRLPALNRHLQQNADYARKEHINDGVFLGKNTVFADMRTRGPGRVLEYDAGV